MKFAIGRDILRTEPDIASFTSRDRHDVEHHLDEVSRPVSLLRPTYPISGSCRLGAPRRSQQRRILKDPLTQRWVDTEWRPQLGKSRTAHEIVSCLASKTMRDC